VCRSRFWERMGVLGLAVLELTLRFGLAFAQLTLYLELAFAQSAVCLGLAFVGLALRIGVAFDQPALRLWLPFAELALYSGLAFAQLALLLWIRRCWYWRVLISRPSRKERSMKAHPHVSRFKEFYLLNFPVAAPAPQLVFASGEMRSGLG
jgi:hypothetical protein